MEEKWTALLDYPKFKISNFGRFKGSRGKINKQFLHKEGYYSVGVCNGRKDKRSFLTHRLVALYFCNGKDGERNYVDHINHIKTDNRACNLRWVTQKENINNRLFLTFELIHEIYNLFEKGNTPKEVYDFYKNGIKVT